MDQPFYQRSPTTPFLWMHRPSVLGLVLSILGTVGVRTCMYCTPTRVNSSASPATPCGSFAAEKHFRASLAWMRKRGSETRSEITFPRVGGMWLGDPVSLLASVQASTPYTYVVPVVDSSVFPKERDVANRVHHSPLYNLFHYQHVLIKIIIIPQGWYEM